MGVKKKRLLIIAAVVFVVAVLAVFLWPGEREPEYQGKQLSEWLEVYDRQYQHRNRPSDVEVLQAWDAVREMGTNCVPQLLRWIRYERPAWRRIIIHIIPTGKGEIRADLAVAGFRMVGVNAACAVPELTAMSHDLGHPDTARRAQAVLENIFMKIAMTNGVSHTKWFLVLSDWFRREGGRKMFMAGKCAHPLNPNELRNVVLFGMGEGNLFCMRAPR